MLPRLHIVTDDATLQGTAFAVRAERVMAALGPSVALHLRGHGVAARALHALAARLRPIARREGAMLLVNDRVDIACALRLDGVQLGSRSLPVQPARRLLHPGCRIGLSVHDTAETVGSMADFFVLGTIFESPSHPARPAAGVARVAEAARATDAPVIAIGGVTPDRIAVLLDAGAHGVAALSGVWAAADPVASARAYAGALAHASVVS